MFVKYVGFFSVRGLDLYVSLAPTAMLTIDIDVECIQRI